MEPSHNFGAASVQEAARRLGVSHSKVKELCRTGELKSFRIGRRRLVSYDAIVRFITSQEAKL